MSGYRIRLKDNSGPVSLEQVLLPPARDSSDLAAVAELLARHQNQTAADLHGAGAEFLGELWKGGREEGRDDESGEQTLFVLSCVGAFSAASPGIRTSNLMGVVRFHGEDGLHVTLEVGSRFDSDRKQYFLNYLLHKVFAGRFVAPVDIGESNLWDILLILAFRTRFEKAYAQGIFKSYEEHRHNDANFRGRLDLNAHLRQNTPFRGTLTYTTRQFSWDNPVTRLIRSALWHIEMKYPRLLDNGGPQFTEARQAIERHTLGWRGKEVLSIVRDNLRPLRHPYFTAYEPLRKICLAILRDEGAAFYEEKATDAVEGVLFDGAWLWENYVATLLIPLGMTHFVYGRLPRLRVFKERAVYLYPDFYHERHKVILDTKYKREWKREDLHQILSYMFLTGSRRGGVILPPGSIGGTHSLATACGEEHPHSFWPAHSETFWHDIVFQFPSSSGSAEEFIRGMAAAENQLKADAASCWQE